MFLRIIDVELWLYNVDVSVFSVDLLLVLFIYRLLIVSILTLSLGLHRLFVDRGLSNRFFLLS